MNIIGRIAQKQAAYFRETGTRPNRAMLPSAEAGELTDWLREHPDAVAGEGDDRRRILKQNHGATLVEGDEFKVWAE